MTTNFRNESTGSVTRTAVLMTDRGIYDNLGLSVLEPGRWLLMAVLGLGLICLLRAGEVLRRLAHQGRDRPVPDGRPAEGAATQAAGQPPN